MKGTYLEKLWQVLGTIDQSPDPYSCRERFGEGDDFILPEDLLPYRDVDLRDKKYFDRVFTCSPLFSARPALLELDALLGNGDKQLNEAEVNAILGIRIKEKPVEQIIKILLKLRRHNLHSFFRYIHSLDEESRGIIYKTMGKDPRYLNTVLRECYDLSRSLIPENADEIRTSLIYLLMDAEGLLSTTYKGKGRKEEVIYQRLASLIRNSYDISRSLLMDNADEIRGKLLYVLQSGYGSGF